jgi:predicted house-cleaning noncanonical NTP pyrophosphatase (MazG superfamily)
MSDSEIENEARSYGAAIAKLMGGAVGPSQRKAARKARTKEIISNTDRRHLRATGRNEQWNIRCRTGLKEQIEQIASDRDHSMAALVEEVMEAFIASLAQPALKNGADHA